MGKQFITILLGFFVFFFLLSWPYDYLKIYHECSCFIEIIKQVEEGHLFLLLDNEFYKNLITQNHDCTTVFLLS